MKTIMLISFFGIVIMCNAQKNELSLGYSGMGYFFDSTKMKLSSFNKCRNISVTYSINILNNFYLSTSYSNYFFGYVDPKTILKDNTVETRNMKRVGLHIRYALLDKAIRLKLSIGINRNWGAKLNHYFYFSQWREPVREGIGYNKYGASAGLLIAHKIFKGLYGELDSEFVRMSKGIDLNQMFVSYRIGYQF